MATTGQAATRPQERPGPPPGEAEAGARDEDAGPLTDAGTLRELAAIGDDLMGAMRESIAVAKAEARLFGSTAVLAVAIAAVVAVLLAGAWFSLVAAFALGLGALGVPGWLAPDRIPRTELRRRYRSCGIPSCSSDSLDKPASRSGTGRPPAP